MNGAYSNSFVILITTRDRAAFVHDLLRSIRQRVGEASVVVADSSVGSETKEICDAMGATHLRTHPQGKSSSMNLAVDQISAEIVIFLDDDVCVSSSDWLVELLAPFDDPAVAYVSGRVLAQQNQAEAQFIWESSGALDKGCSRIRLEPGDPHFISRRVASVAMGANHAVRRSTLIEVGCHDELFGPGEPIPGSGADTDLALKVFYSGASLEYAPKAVVLHRHPESMRDLYRRIFFYGVSDGSIHLRYFFATGRLSHLVEATFFQPGKRIKNLLRSMLGLHPFPPLLVVTSLGGVLCAPLFLLKAIALRKASQS